MNAKCTDQYGAWSCQINLVRIILEIYHVSIVFETLNQYIDDVLADIQKIHSFNMFPAVLKILQLNRVSRPSLKSCLFSTSGRLIIFVLT